NKHDINLSSQIMSNNTNIVDHAGSCTFLIMSRNEVGEIGNLEILIFTHCFCKTCDHQVRTNGTVKASEGNYKPFSMKNRLFSFFGDKRLWFMSWQFRWS